MTRPRRFEEYRLIGTRDDMIVYDTDDPEQSQMLEDRLTTDQLMMRNLVQTFAPDIIDEARNRGFRPVR